MDESRQLAQWVYETKYEDLPQEVVEAMKTYILDTFGCIAGLATLPWAKTVYQFVKELGSAPQATILYYGDKTSADNAAFLNGSMGHGYEFDDTNYKVGVHPGVVVVPAALALAERQGSTGKQFLTACAVGYEVIVRLCGAMFPRCQGRGHHHPPAAGPFAAAMAAAKILDLNYEQTLNALAIAGSHAAGLLEYTQTGGEVKRIHAGIPSQSGVRSALLAAKGLTGPPTVLEGKWGFLRVWSDTEDAGPVVRGLGQDYILTGTGLKAHSCCGATHSALEATLQLVEKNQIAPSHIDDIEIGTSWQIKRHVGAIYRPEDILAAQFSAPYTLALAILRGAKGYIRFDEGELNNPDILALADKIHMEPDDEMERFFEAGNYSGAKVRIALKDGRAYQTTYLWHKGLPENPMTKEEVRDKFRSLIIPAVGQEKAERAIGVVEALERAEGVSNLVSQLVV